MTTEAAGPFAALGRAGPQLRRWRHQSYLGSRAATIYGGASEVQDIIAKNVLGLKAKSKAS